MKPPRGTQDFLPPASERFAAIEQTGAEVFERAGYRRVITPMFEDTDALTKGIGESTDIVRKEQYTFLDRSDNSLTLRPEGTAPVIRAIVSNHLWDAGLPIKLWYSAAMFRYERPQKGRYRQHHQLGIEAVGSEDPALDAEVIGLGGELLARVGVSDATLLLNSMGHEECRAAYCPALQDFLFARRQDLDEDCNRRMEQNPMRVFDCKNAADQKILAEAPALEAWLCEACRAHFDAVQGYLKDAGISFTLAPRLVRGFDYYTRTTFEYQSPSLEAAQNTVCGGGRYDKLVEWMGGPPLPGIGFGSGIERLIHGQEAAGKAPGAMVLEVYVIPVDSVYRPDAVRLVNQLRGFGLRADTVYLDWGIKKSLARANKIGVRYAYIVGEAEVRTGLPILKDMETGAELPLAPQDVLQQVKKGR